MDFQTFFTSLQNRVPLVVAIPVLVSVVVLALQSFSKASDDYPSIPLYKPETLNVGNYKKRWSYDNPNVLREAYEKVSCLLKLLADLVGAVVVVVVIAVQEAYNDVPSIQMIFSRYGRAKEINWLCRSGISTN